jgi:hypothetical protein
MADKNVTITLGGTTSAPTWGFSGDIDGNGVLVVPKNEKVKVKWEVNTNVNGATAPQFAQQNANGVEGIVFTGGVEDPWASGQAPPVEYKDQGTKATLEDDNTASHAAVNKHYYQVNVMWEGTLLTKDPEIDEQGAG